MSNFNAFWVLLGKFYTANKDIINTLLSGSLPVIVPAGIGLIWWYRQQRRQRQLPAFSSPFECISPRSEVLERVYSGDKKNPLADFNIPYQSRQINRNIRRELEQELEKTGWLLILGRTGSGKTREAAELVQLLNHEGWTVLRLKVGEWVDVPTREQLAEIGTNRKLLFFLDDLNQRMSYSIKDEISLKAKDCALAPMYVPLQERLLQTLEAYEEFCGKMEMRVIATARNESQRTEPSKPNELEKLQLEKYPKLWQRFTHYELPEPSDEAVVRLLTEVVPETQIHAKTETYSEIAKRNDSTFRNVVENLVRLENRQLPLTSQNYRDTLQATWEKRYQDVVKRYPISASIYDAIELLRLCDLPLERVIIEPTALLFRQGSFWQRWIDRWKIRQALTYLIEAENILKPRDGQIEGKGQPVDVEKYIHQLTSLILQLAGNSCIVFNSLFNFGLKLTTNLNQPRESLIVFDKLLNSQQTNAIDENLDLVKLRQRISTVWFLRGYALTKMEDPTEAVYSLKKALQLKPDFYYAEFLLGILLIEIKCYPEAIDSFNQVLKVQPKFHEAWFSRGVALEKLNNYLEAIESWDKALQIKPDLYEAWFNRGVLLGKLDNHLEAIESWDKALQIKPDFYEAWYNRGVSLHKTGYYSEAIDSLDQALSISPNYTEAWVGRRMSLLNLVGNLTTAAFPNQVLQIKSELHQVSYNKARGYAIQNNLESTLENLQSAIDFNPHKYRELAKINPDFDSIRDDSRFQALMQGKQESKK